MGRSYFGNYRRSFLHLFLSHNFKIYYSSALDSEFENLAFVVDGEASITIENDVEVAKLKKGDWISEFSFITGDKTSANVISNDIFAISWSKATLENLKIKKPELFEKINSLIARNLCEKLIRSNKK